MNKTSAHAECLELGDGPIFSLVGSIKA